MGRTHTPAGIKRMAKSKTHLTFIQRDKCTCMLSASAEEADNGLLIILIVGAPTASLKAEMC